LKNRLSRFDVASVRTKLRAFYNSWISAVDPGLPIAGRDTQGRTQASIPITERYIQPDFIVPLAESQIPPAGEVPDRDPESRKEIAESNRREPQDRDQGASYVRIAARDRRVPLDEYLKSQSQALIVGEAGSGKSSLLRFVALDILADEPILGAVKARLQKAIPVWLPFALWVRMSVDRGAPTSIEDVVAEFFRSQGEGGLADDMRRAVSGQRIVLLVDGLDEASNPTAARTLVAVLTALASRTGIPILATSRPHGTRDLSELAGNWDRCNLAALSDEQRHALAGLWFAVLESFEGGASATPSQIRARAKRRADAFVTALQLNAGISRLSQTPLFLLAFLSLHRRGQTLPRNRFAASQEIVEQLMEHQPRRRDMSALATRSSAGEPRMRDRVIADFAFALQAGELRGSIPDAATEDDAVARAANLICARQQSADHDSAEGAARAIFSFTEERAGLLVNKAQGNVGFLHLSLQEYLAARHVIQRSLAERVAFVSANAGSMRWREPILYLLFMTVNEAEVGRLVEAIETAPVLGADASAVRDGLLTDAVFADFAHDLGIVRRLAAEMFAETELTAWGARRTHLLTAAVDGLFCESVGEICRAKVAEWVPDRHGYGRAAAIQAMPDWDAALKPACVPVLMRCLRSENEYVWRQAAQALPIVADRNSAVKETLMRLAREAPSLQTAQAAIVSLGCGWVGDEEVGAMAEALRTNSHRGLCLDAIRIRAKRRETDAADLHTYFAIAHRKERYTDTLLAPDLAEHFATYHREAFVQKLETAITALMGDRLGRIIPLIGSLFICDSRNALARQELLQALATDWVFHHVFEPGHFPVDRVDWTPELIGRVEAHIRSQERVGDYALYWIGKAIPLPLVKQRCLEILRGEPHLGFWCSRALVEIWGKSDADVQAFFTAALASEPETVAQIAEELSLVIDDRAACREALLRALRADVSRTDFILRGCKNLGITAADAEMVQAAVEAGARTKAPLYYDMWCQGLIAAFPKHPDVRTIALDEVMRRDGSLGTVARSYAADEDMCRRVLRVICPLDERARMRLVQSLEAAAASSDGAAELLSAARQDTNGLVCAESIMGWVESKLARGALTDADLTWLERELDTVGPEYEKRRTAVVVGLLLAGAIERFARAKRYDAKPLIVEASPNLTRDDMYLRRLLPRWDELSRALGGEESVFERLEITPERTLRAIHGGIPGAERLFTLLMAQVPNARHVHKSDLIAALAEMEPRGNHMRELIASLLLTPFGGPTLGDHWAELRAGELFAEYFREESDLRGKIIDAFKSNPDNGGAAGALAELLLREDDISIKDLLVAGIAGRRYRVGAHFKLVSALASAEVFIEEIEKLLARDIEPDEWSLPYWVPALVRRIKMDGEVRERMLHALGAAASVSMKLTLAALLARAAGSTDELKSYAATEMGRLDEDPIPAIGFDLTSYAHRPMFQIMTELAG
jgi:NACHT domain-containing protein